MDLLANLQRIINILKSVTQLNILIRELKIALGDRSVLYL